MVAFPHLNKKETSEILRFLNDCVIADINSRVKEAVIKIKSSSKIKLPDSIILGTLVFLGIPVITSDHDFSKVNLIDVMFYENN